MIKIFTKNVVLSIAYCDLMQKTNASSLSVYNIGCFCVALKTERQQRHTYIIIIQMPNNFIKSRFFVWNYIFC